MGGRARQPVVLAGSAATPVPRIAERAGARALVDAPRGCGDVSAVSSPLRELDCGGRAVPGGALRQV